MAPAPKAAPKVDPAAAKPVAAEEAAAAAPAKKAEKGKKPKKHKEEKGVKAMYIQKRNSPAKPKEEASA